MTIGDIVNAREAVRNLAGEKISTRLAYSFMRFLKKTDGEEEFFAKEKLKIITEFCERDGEGKLIQSSNGDFKIVPGKETEANKRLAEVVKTEAEDPGIRFDLEQLDELKITVRDMNAMFPFITEAE